MYNNDDARFEKLKKELFMEGTRAIEEFLGYSIQEDEDKDVTENRMNEVFEQMPPEDLEDFYDNYDI